MSVILTLRVSGDPAKLEQLVTDQPNAVRSISERAKKDYGLIAHRFYGSDGEIMVVDEWPDQESFQRFWEAEGAAIGPIMAQVASSEPVITFWRKLETHDEIGWD